MHKVVNGCSLAISGEELGLSKVFSAQSCLLLNTLACFCSLIVERVSTEVASHILFSSKRNRICHINASTIIQTMQQRTNRLLIDLSHSLSIILHRTLQASKLSSCLLNEFLSTLSSIFHLGKLSLIISITDSYSRVISRLSISNSLLLGILSSLLFHESLTLHGHVTSLVECLLCVRHISRYDTICILTKLRVIQLSSLFSSQLREVRIAILQHRHDSSIFKGNGRSSRSLFCCRSLSRFRSSNLALYCRSLHLYLTSTLSTIILYH